MSDRFTELHRRCSVPNVVSVPTVSPIFRQWRVCLHQMGVCASPSSAAPRAGRGLHLVKCALFSTAFAHLHLTIIDYDRPPGEQRNELWNTTPVEILPKYPEERVTELYARIDVLLAPSIAAAGSWVPTGEASANASARKRLHYRCCRHRTPSFACSASSMATRRAI